MRIEPSRLTDDDDRCMQHRRVSGRREGRGKEEETWRMQDLSSATASCDDAGGRGGVKVVSVKERGDPVTVDVTSRNESSLHESEREWEKRVSRETDRRYIVR